MIRGVRSAVVPARSLATSLLLTGLRWALAVLALGTALLLLAAVASTAAFPRIHAAGPDVLLTALLAALGTGAAPLLPLAGLGAGFAVARSAGRRGEAAAAAALGWGPWRIQRSLAPLWIGLALVCFGLGTWAEPAAWRAIHYVRGAPLASAVAWAGLQAGEVRPLSDGGALVLRDGAIAFTTGDRSWRGTAGLPEPLPDQGGWRIDGLEVVALDELGREARWQVSALTLELEPGRRDRWLAPPTSPWTLGWGALRARDGRRAAMVLHRRIALAACVPLMALLGWLIGWAPGGARQATAAWRVPAVAGCAIALFAATRSADHAVAWGALPGGLGGWAPALAAATLLAAFALLRRGP
jgi:hypothetical protein